MAKIKQPFGEPRFVPAVGRTVEHGEVLEVPDHELASYLEGGWEPSDDKTRKAGKQLLDDGVITVLAGVKPAAAMDGKDA